MKKICVALLVLCLVGASAQALIVLPVPGETGNTVTNDLNAGTNWINLPGEAVTTETATTWRNRSLTAAGGDNWCGIPNYLPYSVYCGTAASTAPELLTTVGGFDPYEQVDVWVLFSSSFKIVNGVQSTTVQKNCWIDAAIDDGSLTTPLTSYSWQAGNAVRTGAATRVEASVYYELMAGYLGKAEADDNGNIFLRADGRLSVPVVDGLPMAGVSAGDRSIFHGFAVYEVPEPATMTLLGLGALTLLRKRN
ncbi:MAG: PEP-CTERM sorting domain-containing protein [Planctomycetaceae bacterium]|nr:PEP-CTERM sorting domain-containing protein [Planctomycetaceae bacterium]